MASPVTPFYWYDGHVVPGDTLSLSLHDPGWLYGATVFTTLRIYDGNLEHPWTAWSAHVQRLAQSQTMLAWTAPRWAQIEQGARHLAQHYPVLRITLFPDGRELLVGRSLPPDLEITQTEGITAWVAADSLYHRYAPIHKTGNYLSSWLAIAAARKIGAQEAILQNSLGHWLETSTGNLWGWANGHWYTPPLAAGILPGVMRSRILRGLQQQGAIVHEVPWSPALTQQLTFFAHANSIRTVIPIRTVLQLPSAVNYNPDQDKRQQLTAAWQQVD